MMRGIAFKLLPVVLLASCATTPGIKTVLVDRPVIKVEKCIKKEDVPQRPEDLKRTPMPKDLETALSVAIAKISEWTRYGNKTDEIMKNCS